MSSHAYLELDAPAKVLGGLDPRRARLFLGSSQDTEVAHLNARAAATVAKPGTDQHLRTHMRREVAAILKRQPAFAGIFVLTSHKDRRLIRVHSLWDTAA